jgi:hypothetical protein
MRMLAMLIENADTSSIKLVPAVSDTIEGAGAYMPKTLNKQYDSSMLASNGTNEWCVAGNSIGDGFVF